jgi:hypothetical protein
MKIAVLALVAFSSFAANKLALADADDAKWIAQCIQDNKDEKVSVEVITKYCSCMNNKMSEEETKSVSNWEKSHPKEAAECDKESGWK